MTRLSAIRQVIGLAGWSSVTSFFILASEKAFGQHAPVHLTFPPRVHDLFWSPRLTSQNFPRYVVRADEKLTAFVELGDRTDVKPNVKIRIRVG
jgi:hypothetical protein